MMELTSRLASIRQKQSQLKELDKGFGIFGSGFHRHLHQLGPCLSEDQINEFESQQRVRLPEDYRQFLLQVGNGGAGPGYGLLTLEEAIQSPFAPASLSNPFRYTSLYNPDNDPAIWELTKDWHDDDERWGGFFNTITNGSLHICGLGCMEIVLIVSGEERGNLWCNYMSSDQGVFPIKIGKPEHVSYPTLSADSQRVSFLDWYENWLDVGLSSQAMK